MRTTATAAAAQGRLSKSHTTKSAHAPGALTVTDGQEIAGTIVSDAIRN
jgi:hypothetical protein